MVVVPAGASSPVPTNSPNMLACQGGGYALCFLSGPPTIIAGAQALPCVLGKDGLVANCTCQYYSSVGTYYVVINGILSQGAYYEAVKQCGADGSGARTS